MTRYRDIPMSQRIEKIGELLAKGVYLYTQKQKDIGKSPDSCDNKEGSLDGNTSASSLSECRTEAS